MTIVGLLLWTVASCSSDETASRADAASDASGQDGRARTTEAAPPEPPPEPEKRIASGMARVAEAHIFAEPDSSSHKIGILRWGTRFEVSDTQGSDDDQWVRMKEVGWIEGEDVITRTEGEPKMGFVPVEPDMDEGMPFRYARVTAKEVPVYNGPPREGADPQRWFKRNLLEDYFFTIDKFVNMKKGYSPRRMYRTTRYTFIPRDGTTVVSGPQFEGIEVDDDVELPFLWVTDPTARLCESPRPAAPDGGLQCPEVERHAKLPYFERREKHGPWYRTKNNQWIPALQVAFIDEIDERPDEVGPDERWIHVDLSNQFAALYEGDQMVYVTLVSSGDDGHETPTGTYRVQSKHVSATMDNEDNPSGPYMIQDVPWVMFFRGSYAIHGAFWHDRFGLKTSHGCVNLPPSDARRFFNFTPSPELPEGWHAVYTPPGTEGTVVHITD